MSTDPGVRTLRGIHWILAGALAFILLGTLGGSLIWFTCGFRGCPDPSDLGAYQPGGAPILLDRAGNELAELHPMETSTISLDSLPSYVPAAFIAIEDRRFYQHRGVDWRRVAGATVRNVTTRGIREGASTLTMQLARTLFSERIPGAEQTFRRKLLEVRMADRIERRFSKDEILELYLNHVYMGAGAYGIEAGARHYFDLSAGELSLGDAALLAGILPAPAHYDPRRNPERALARRNLVLRLMEGDDAASSEEIAAAREEIAAAREAPLEVTDDPPARTASSRAPYFVETVRRFLEDEFGEELYRIRLRVFTTLDSELQNAAQEELVRQLERVETGVHGSFDGPIYDPQTTDASGSSEYLQGAAVFLDARSGDLLALVGGRDFRASRYDRTSRAQRQMGSAFKPFVYAAAIGNGYVASQPLADLPFTLVGDDSPAWSPGNYDGAFRGTVSARRSLVESLNVPTVRLAMAVGMEEVVRMATLAGIQGPIPPVPAAALGTASASPIEVATAYAGLARFGARPLPRSVLRVESELGEVIFESEPETELGIDPRVAYLVTDILVGVVDRGTGTGARSAGYQGPVAGKTGTTQEAHDVWFAGYTPEVAGVVWIGFDQPRPIVSGATGGRLAAPVWGAIMSQGLEGRDPPPAWEIPNGIVQRSVDPSTGLVLRNDCPFPPQDGAVRELFLEEFIPRAACPEPPVVEEGEGLRERLGGFFRGLVGRSEPEEEEEEELPVHRPPDVFQLNSGVEVLLGLPRVPLIREPGAASQR